MSTLEASVTKAGSRSSTGKALPYHKGIKEMLKCSSPAHLSPSAFVSWGMQGGHHQDCPSSDKTYKLSELRAGCHVLPLQWPALGGEYISIRRKLMDALVKAIQGGSKAGGKAQKMELHASGEGQARRQIRRKRVLCPQSPSIPQVQ